MKRLSMLVLVITLVLGNYNYAESKTQPYSATINMTEVYSNDNAIGKLYRGNVVQIKKWGTEWTEIVYDTGFAKVKTKDLYSYDGFLNFLENNPSKVNKQAEVKYNNVRMRDDGSDNSNVISILGKKSNVNFISSSGGWAKVQFQGKTGFVRNNSIKVVYTVKVPKYVNNQLLRDRIVDFALQYEGNKYVWGGTSLETGADCSGFVGAVLKEHGIWVPRVSLDQSSYGKLIPLDELQKGDLIFYMRDGRIGHVAMYIGDGMIIQALNERVGTIISRVDFKQPILARDVISGR